MSGWQEIWLILGSNRFHYFKQNVPQSDVIIFYTSNANGILTQDEVNAQLAITSDVGMGDTYSADFSSSVKGIDSSAFMGCTGLTSIVIPDSVTSIAYMAFYNCNALKSVIIPNRVTSISHCAFGGCLSLTSIGIPDSVTSIGNMAFESCANLSEIYFDGDAPTVEEDAFSNTAPGAVAYVYSSAKGFPAEGEFWNGLIVKYRGGDSVIWAKVCGEPIENGGVFKSSATVSKASITASPGATISIQKGAAAFNGANLTASNIYTVTISDAGVTQLVFSIIVDSVKPVVSVSPVDFSGPIANNIWTNSGVVVNLSTNAVLISGSVRYQYGIPDETSAVDENGWVDISGNIFTIPQPSNGEITVNYKFRAISQTGIAGNATTKWTFSVDTVRPVYTVYTQKETGLSGYGQNVVINFSEPVTLYYTLNETEGSKKSSANENNSVTLSTDGFYTAIRAVDKAGNLTTNSIEDIIISKTKPSVVVVSPSDVNGAISNNKWTNSDVTVDLSVTSSAPVIYQYGVPDATGVIAENAWVTITGNIFKISKPVNGELTVSYKFRAISQTGVAGNASTKWTFNIDTIAPVCTLATQKETGFSGYGQNVVINFSEPVTFNYKLDGIEGSKKSYANENHSLTLSTEGIYTTISAIDKAGNLTTKSIANITINKTKPVITLAPSIPSNQKTDTSVIIKITATPESSLNMRYQVKEGADGEWKTIATANGKTGVTYVIPQKIAANKDTYYFQAINSVSGVAEGQKSYKANITSGISVVIGSKIINLNNPLELAPVYYFTGAIPQAQITYSEDISSLIIKEYLARVSQLAQRTGAHRLQRNAFRDVIMYIQNHQLRYFSKPYFSS